MAFPAFVDRRLKSLWQSLIDISKNHQTEKNKTSEHLDNVYIHVIWLNYISNLEI